MKNKNLLSAVEKMIGKYYSGLSIEAMCAIELYINEIRENDLSSNGELSDLHISDSQRIPIMNALRDIERMNND